MMLSELPSLEETVAGKELIELGEARGKVQGQAEGLAEATLLLLTRRLQRVPKAVQKQILALPKATTQTLLMQADDFTSLDALKQWLVRHASEGD